MSAALHLFHKALRRYRSDGLVSLLWSVKTYFMYRTREEIRQRGLFQGTRSLSLITEIRYRYQRIRYDAPAQPYKPIWINPSSIDHWNRGSGWLWGLGRIKGGTWDRRKNCKPLDDLRIYTGLRQRFEEGREWEDTIYYEQAKETIETDGSIAGYTDIEDYREIRCHYVDNLFTTIRDEGYRPNFKGYHNVPKCDKRKTTWWFWTRLEPLVVIGRDGEIYLNDGTHRFTIARILGIDSIPANVLCRHHEWQRIRDKFDAVDDVCELNPSLQSYACHPDLQDVID